MCIILFADSGAEKKRACPCPVQSAGQCRADLMIRPSHLRAHKTNRRAAVSRWNRTHKKRVAVCVCVCELRCNLFSAASPRSREISLCAKTALGGRLICSLEFLLFLILTIFNASANACWSPAGRILIKYFGLRSRRSSLVCLSSS